ncbi:carbamoyltransferase family protein [Candidatus Entotheonella palauensis]|uniref:carbamoyltransferase family protein n=1 Tax=Candidatus Entotheonella palauensis TaxID=93172 RepID=UPI000B7C61D0|nr:carbamoyltransferase C-terminal domain-containing protein [Candidatus Entotheonella palauensis]
MLLLGVFHSYSDPSAALVHDGRVVAFVEEERLSRVKHAKGAFPSRAIASVLETGGVSLGDIDAIAQAWDCPAYDSGAMAAHYDHINALYPANPSDIAYQQRHLAHLTSAHQESVIRQHLRQQFGEAAIPPIRFVKHHLAHACMAYFHSGMDNVLVLTIDGSGELVLTIDGSGEAVSTAWWRGSGGRLELLHEVNIPHSLGWFYSAFTEYLGFQAYDGEYKLMGLAAYGQANPVLREKLEKLIWYDGAGGFVSDPMRLSRGPRQYSYYYPDALADYMEKPPRAWRDELTQWHMDLAYEVQRRLEILVAGMVQHWSEKTGLRQLAVAGGVGLNVKMNGHLFTSGLIDDLFVHPLCADPGVSIGAAMALEYLDHPNELAQLRQKLRRVDFGPAYDDAAIEQVLKGCKLHYTYEPMIEARVADLLARGQVVGWFQGGVEGGPRALGHRSILADPRSVASRDKVNSVIKFREFWRPFCPSMTPAGAERYLSRYTDAPFMVLAFPCRDAAAREVPAIVHVDGSCRPQIVDAEQNPRYFRLLRAFDRLTGVPCLLNTSFNVKGEPIVCTPHDALRTFAATGLDALALGSYLLVKPEVVAR